MHEKITSQAVVKSLQKDMPVYQKIWKTIELPPPAGSAWEIVKKFDQAGCTFRFWGRALLDRIELNIAARKVELALVSVCN